jgi:hypothetical protein
MDFAGLQLGCTSVAAGRSLDDRAVGEVRGTGTPGLTDVDVLDLPSGTDGKGLWGHWAEEEAGTGSTADGRGPIVAWSLIKVRVSFLVCGEDKEGPGTFDGVWGQSRSVIGGGILRLGDPILRAVDVGDKNRVAGADSVLEGGLNVGVGLRDLAACGSGGRGRLEASLSSDKCPSATSPREDLRMSLRCR